MPYTPFGPWTNGGAPGIQASFLNALEAFLQTVNSAATDNLISSTAGALNLTPTGSVLNGSTSGTATLYQFQRGTFKQVVVLTNSFRNGSGSAQNLAIPTPFTNGFSFYSGGFCPVQFLSSGVAQTIGIITGLAAGGGSIALQTTLNRYSFGDNYTGVDTISFLGSQPGAVAGILILQGI